MYPSVYVITCPEHGWDCVIAAFDTEEQAELFVEIMGHDQYVAHRVSLQSKFIAEDYQ